MTRPRHRHDDDPPAPDHDGRRGSQRWFTPEQEAENCTRLLGHARHGLDSSLPVVATPPSPQGPAGP